MKNRFCIEEYPSETVVMCCETEEQQQIFCTYLYNNGCSWSTGSSYLEFVPTLGAGGIGYLFNTGQYSNKVQTLVSRNYEILYFEDFDWSEFNYDAEIQTEEDNALFDDFVRGFIAS